MLKIGITGGIGSGKTTVCKLFAKEFNIPIYYADQRAKGLMNFNPELKKKLKEAFGPKIYHSNGRLNRPILSNLIFNDKSLITKINELVHPAVYQDGENWFDSLPHKTAYALKEAALLFESDSAKQLDKIIVVHVEDEIRIQRVMKRDGISKDKVLARMKNQWPQEQKIKNADYLIYNKDRSDLMAQILKIHKELNSIKQDI